MRIDRGEFVTLIGHSGCGKNTLLNIIAGFEQASAGGVILDGKEVTAPGLDRIALMTNGPEARLAETVEVNIPQPRSRETMIETAEYTRLRNHILHVLLRGSHAFAARELSLA